MQAFIAETPRDDLAGAAVHLRRVDAMLGDGTARRLLAGALAVVEREAARKNPTSRRGPAGALARQAS